MRTVTNVVSILDLQIEAYRDVRAEIALLTKRKESLKETIIEAMGDANQIVDEYGHVLVELLIRTRKDFDKKKFEQDFSDIYAEYLVEKTENVFHVSK